MNNKLQITYPDSTIDIINGPPIEYTKALHEFGDKVDLLNQVIESFLVRLEKQILAMKKLMKDKNADEIKREAHKLYGAASNLRAPALSLAAGELENSAVDQQWSDIEKYIEAIEVEFEKLKRYKNKDV